MLKMKESSRVFLEKYLPEALEMKTRREVLESLYTLIDEKGFAPPKYEDYNDGDIKSVQGDSGYAQVNKAIGRKTENGKNCCNIGR